MMKKLFPLMLVFLMMVGVASAQVCTPFPVWGKVDYFGNAISGLDVKIKVYDFRGNLQDEWVTSTNENGEYTDDLANNLDACWFRSAEVVIDACGSDGPCPKVVEIFDKQKVRADFIFSEIAPNQEGPIVDDSGDETVIVKVEKPVYVCWNGEKKVSSQLCPEQPPKEIIKEVPAPEDDKGPNQVVLAAVSIVILGLTSIWSWMRNTDLKGKYRWMPGMAGILRRKKEDYIEAYKAKDYKKGKKLEGTILKMSATITKKYLQNLRK